MSFKLACSFQVGDVFFERHMGGDFKLTVKSIPAITTNSEGKKEVRWTASLAGLGEAPIHYLIVEGYEHCGPKINV